MPRKPFRSFSLRVDPSRTLQLRLSCTRLVRRLFNELIKRVIQIVNKEDSFGLIPTPLERLLKGNTSNQNNTLSINYIHNNTPDQTTTKLSPGIPLRDEKSRELLTNANWRFLDNPEKAKAFRQWIDLQAREVLLSSSTTQLYDGFIRDGYKKGLNRAFTDAKRKTSASLGEVNKEEFLRVAFDTAIGQERFRLLTGRTRQEVESAINTLSNDTVRVLTDYLLKGGSDPKELTDLLSVVMDRSEAKIESLARTEIVRAQAEGQLVMLEILGENEVGIEAEFTTAGDGVVCPQCSALEGRVFLLSQAHGVIPVHPNCRCAFQVIKRGEIGQRLRAGPSKRLARLLVEQEQGNVSPPLTDLIVSNTVAQNHGIIHSIDRFVTLLEQLKKKGV